VAERARRGERSNGAASDRPEPFPSYEELASDLLEALDEAGLSIEDVRHELEPGAGERRFECTVRLQPQPFVEIEAEFVLGDGGYELQELGEVAGWLDTVQTLLGKAFPADDRPSVHVGLAALGGSVLVEKLTAEHSWLIDFDEPPDFTAMAQQVLAALRLVPQLADRLPM